MVKGISKLSAIPMRSDPSDAAEMVNQLIFGETYDVLEQRKKWIRIRLHHDRYEGWIDRKQASFMDDAQAEAQKKTPIFIASDLIELVSRKDGGSFFPIFLVVVSWPSPCGKKCEADIARRTFRDMGANRLDYFPSGLRNNFSHPNEAQPY